MRKYAPIIAGLAVVAALAIITANSPESNELGEETMKEAIELPEPGTESEVSLERTIANRRSRRVFTDETLSLNDVGQILWAAQGITEHDRNFRASPSAGATFPLEVFIAIGENSIEGLEPGVYQYKTSGHSLSQVSTKDVRNDLAAAALGQGFVADAPVVYIVTADYARTAGRYGAQRGERYVHMEVGHVGGNIYLQCEALDLGTVAVGAFSDEEVGEVLDLPANLDALYIMPVGKTH